MKKCNNCGKIVPEDTSFCPDCGSSIFNAINDTSADVSTQETENSPFNTVNAVPTQSDSVRSAFEQPDQSFGKTDPVVTQQPFTSVESMPIENKQPLYGSAPVTQTATMTAEVTNDKANVGLVILSVFIPIVGIILWIVKKKETPKAAKSYGLAGLITMLVNLVLSIVIFVVAFTGTFAVLDKTMEYADKFDSSYSEDYDYEDSDDVIVGDDKTKTETEKATESSSTSTVKFASTKYADLDHRQFAINGKVYTLGVTTLQDMIDDGVPFDKDDIANANNNVNPDSGTDFEIELGKYNYATVYVGNFTDDNKAAKDCPIREIYFSIDEDETQNVLSFNFPFSLTEDNLKENSGDPTDYSTNTSNKYTYTTYEYKVESDDYYGESGYNFEFTNGKLSYVTIDYMP